MTDVSRQELISAYLDGELSSDERARVESWLAENAELRQFYDELMSLRTGMQSLPRHELEGDLAPGILRRIAEESRRAGGSSVKQSAVRGSQVQRGTVQPATRWWDRGAGWRRALWPAVAVAAALAVLVYDARQRPEEQQVALAPEAAETQSAPAVVPAELDAPSEGKAADQNARQGPTPMFTSPPAASRAADSHSYGRPAKEAYRPRSAAPAQSAAQEPMSLGAKRQEANESAPRQEFGAPASAMNAEDKLSDAASPPMQGVFVTQQYLKDNTFEKLLESQSIGYERVDVPPNTSYTIPQTPEVSKPVHINLYADDNQSLRAAYVLECNDAEAGQVLSQVPSPLGPGRNGLIVPQQAGKTTAGENQFRVLLLAPGEQPAPGKAKE